mgnify:CR=1 FL=1
MKSEKSDSSGSSYHGDIKQSEYSIIKKGFKLDLSERKKGQQLVTDLSRSSSARQENRADDLMSSYSEGFFDKHQNPSGFTNLEALENKPINIKFKKQIRDRLTKD